MDGPPRFGGGFDDGFASLGPLPGFEGKSERTSDQTATLPVSSCEGMAGLATGSSEEGKVVAVWTEITKVGIYTTAAYLPNHLMYLTSSVWNS